MPAVAGPGSLNESILKTSIHLATSLFYFILSCAFVQYPAIWTLKFLLADKKNNAILILGSVSFCLIIIYIGSYFNQSMELSCFVAGVILASDVHLSEAVMDRTRPLKELFSALFFASLGLHIYPSFLINEGLLLILLAVSCMIFKVILTTTVMMTVKLTLNNSFLIKSLNLLYWLV
jgi:Kef-type K+ transport system membrane component KefB